MAKGIRINDLAKELGVPSKAILEKCIEESIDFGGKKPTAELLASESAALGQLTDARTHLLRALAGLTNDYPSD